MGRSEAIGSATEPRRPFYGRPFAWLLFALLLMMVPAVGYMVNAGMAWARIHPALNALFNGSAAVFLVAGRLAIKNKDEALHRSCMLAGFTASTLFLISYLARYALTGAHKYPGFGWDKTLYLIILISHMLLAMTLLPMVLRALYFGLRGRRASHKRIARWAWPVWMYVSVTGVVVYLMLYPIAAAVYGN